MDLELLRQFVSETVIRIREKRLAEAAATPTDAVSHGMALIVKETGSQVDYVLYSIEGLKKRLDGDKNSKYICGVIQVWKHPDDEYDGATEVNKVAAEKGFGPLMYDIVLADSPNGVIPDRTGTKKAAQTVWHKYAARSDIQSEEIPDDILAGNYLVGDKVLDRRYIAKSPINYKSLVHAHEEAMKHVAEDGESRSSIERAIVSDGLQYFSDRVSA